jgi:archaellum component FlaG (FlaF/FlaG flagellin family)
MNIFNRVLTNFDQFNALEVNNEVPSDFEFNAILWYYTVQKTDLTNTVTTKTNLYGISFLDNPENNPIEEEKSIRFPALKKLVSNGQQDGTSYAFGLNMNFNIINDNPQEAYNPEAINSLFSMNLFNTAMTRLSSTNDSFLSIISQHGDILEEIENLKQLLYTQSDINTINAKISNLELLLRLYSTNQLISTESIKVVTNPLGIAATIGLYNDEPSYYTIDNINTTDLYNSSGIIPFNISVPSNKNFLLNVINNDSVDLTLPNNDRLTIVLDKDLSYKQSVDILITGSEIASQNKKLDIYINTRVPSTTTVNSLTTAEALLIGDIDLPVYYNSINSLPNSAYLWSDFRFDIDFSQALQYTIGDVLEVPLSGNTQIINNSIKAGDSLKLNNFFVGTSSVYDFSGQYVVDSLVGSTSSYIKLDVSNNTDLTNYVIGLSQSLPLDMTTSLSNLPYFTLNKGKKIRVTRINSDDAGISDKYQIEINDIK